MKVGDLVKNKINDRVGLIVQLEHSADHDSFWVRWIGDCDWSWHFPEDVRVINAGR